MGDGKSYFKPKGFYKKKKIDGYKRKSRSKKIICQKKAIKRGNNFNFN